MTDQFEENLKRISRPVGEIQARKDDAVAELKNDLAPSVDAARETIQKLEQFFAAEVRPFVEQIEASGVKDSTILVDVFHLKQAMTKPTELRKVIGEVDTLTFSSISSPPYVDEVFPQKRQSLFFHLRSRLTATGDVEGYCHHLMGQIRDRVERLAEGGARDVVNLNHPAPAKDDSLQVLTNLERDA